jgi:HK97 family phage portal protein
MSLTSRVKAAAMRWVSGGSSTWSAFVGRGKINYTREVGDVLGSSIVAATLGWIARNFPEAPLRVRVRDKEGEYQSTTDVGVVRMLSLLDSPNAYWSGALLWMATLLDFWGHGNAVWLKIRGGPGGAITELWWLPWGTLSPKGSETEYITHYIYKPDGTKEIRIAPEDVVHFRFGIDPENVKVGRSPLSSVIREIYTDAEAANYTAALLTNMGVPGLIIAPEGDARIEKDDAETMKKKAAQTFSGDGRGNTMVLSGAVKVTTLSFSPEQMNLRALRQIPEERVTGVTGVPAIVAGMGAGLARSTFSNFAEAREAGWEECLIPTGRLLSAQIKVQLLPEFVFDATPFLADFDPSEVRPLQEDQNKVWDRAGAALARGAITLATYNNMVGLPVAKDGSDRVYLRPFNVVEVPEDRDERETPETEPLEESTGGEPEEPDTGTEETAPVEPGQESTNGRTPAAARS